MNVRNLSSVLALVVFSSSCVFAQGSDFFWSFSDLNSGATNGDVNNTMLDPGMTTLFLYYDNTNSDLDTGAFLDISVVGDGVSIIGGETFDFDISIVGTDIGDRWGDAFGPGLINPDGSLSMNAFTHVSGFGIDELNTNPAGVFDEGYDMDAGAFLFARVDFQLEIGSTADVLIAPGSGGIIHNGAIFPATFGGATIGANIPEPTTAGLLALGLVGLVARRRCLSKR